MIETCIGFYYALLELFDFKPLYDVTFALLKGSLTILCVYIGASLALRNIQTKQRIDDEVEKVKASNQFIISMIQLTRTMEFCLDNYHSGKFSVPELRGFLAGARMYKVESSDFDCARLSFITESSYSEEELSSLSDPLLYSSILTHSNSYVGSWNERDNIHKELLKQFNLIKKEPLRTSYNNLIIQKYVEALGPQPIITLAQYTENLIENTVKQVHINRKHILGFIRMVDSLINHELIKGRAQLIKIEGEAVEHEFPIYDDESIEQAVFDCCAIN